MTAQERVNAAGYLTSTWIMRLRAAVRKRIVYSQLTEAEFAKAGLTCQTVRSFDPGAVISPTGRWLQHQEADTRLHTSVAVSGDREKDAVPSSLPTA
jgi:hypothetical protein